jgi:hypothetical protein
MNYPPHPGGPQDQPPDQNPNQYGQNQGPYGGPDQNQVPHQGQGQYGQGQYSQGQYSQGQYGQGQGQYGQYPGYQGPHQQSGYPPYGPPHRSYTGLIIAIFVVVLVLLVGGGIALVLVARASNDNAGTEPPVSAQPTQPTEPTQPTQPTQPIQPTQPTPPQTAPPGNEPAAIAAVRSLGQKYASAINTQNEAAATALTCGQDTPGIAYTVAAGRYTSVAVDSVRVDSSLSGQIALKLSASSPVPLTLVAFNRDNRWCVLI